MMWRIFVTSLDYIKQILFWWAKTLSVFLFENSAKEWLLILLQLKRQHQEQSMFFLFFGLSLF